MTPQQWLAVCIGVPVIAAVAMVLGTAFGWWDPLGLINSGEDDDDE